MSKATELVMTPLRMAIWQRSREDRAVVPGELISHSDAGSQYTALRFTEHLALEGIAPSIGSVGDAYDNALMESVIGLFKTECIRTTVFHAGPYKTVSDVEYATAGWVDWWEQPTSARHPRNDHPERGRAGPLRCPHPAGAARMRAARDLGRFTAPSQPLPLAHRRHHCRRTRPTPSPARPDDMITDQVRPLLGMAHWAVIGFRRGVARGEVPPVSVTANAIASPGPSDPPSSITA